MKSIICLCALLFICTSAHAQLTLRIDGIEDTSGQLYIGLYNKADGFTQIEKTYKNWIVSADKKSIILTLEDINPGKYAISIFHDKNKNGLLDKNLLGMPVEIYGFSNNIRPRFAAPSFQECAFHFTQQLDLTVQLR